jgi:hypothetical protein
VAVKTKTKKHRNNTDVIPMAIIVLEKISDLVISDTELSKKGCEKMHSSHLIRP